MWRAIRENPRAVTYAVLMHLVLLALLVIGLDWTPDPTAPGTDKPIQAELVAKDPLKVIEQRKLEEQRKQEQAEAERKRKAEQEAQQLAEQQAEQEAQKKVEQEAQQQAAAEAKRKTEQVAKEKAAVEAKQKAAQEAKQKAAAEKMRKAEQVAKEKAAAEAREKADAAAQRDAEAALQKQLQAEQELAHAKSVLAEYIPYIQDKIQRNWLRPPGSPQGLSCLVKVRLIPGGEVASVNVIRSSGDPVFDRSVESAVLKASPLPLPSDPSLFTHFREINFNFDPGR